MRFRYRAIATLLLVATMAGPAASQPAPPPSAAEAAPTASDATALPAPGPGSQETPRKSRKPGRFSLMAAPLLIFIPELTGEFRVGESFAIAGSVGAGSYLDGSGGIAVAGLQAIYYAVGSFNHGMQLGPHVLFSSSSDKRSEAPADIEDTISVGAVVGYKLVTRVGFTVNAQLSVLAYDDGEGGVALGPLPNVKLGWTF